jgi:hypothetical protein
MVLVFLKSVSTLGYGLHWGLNDDNGYDIGMIHVLVYPTLWHPLAYLCSIIIMESTNNNDFFFLKNIS